MGKRRSKGKGEMGTGRWVRSKAQKREKPDEDDKEEDAHEDGSWQRQW